MNSHRNKTQRDKMRELFRLHAGDRTRVVQAYAAAEQRGEVQRVSDVHNLSPQMTTPHGCSKTVSKRDGSTTEFALANT